MTIGSVTDNKSASRYELEVDGYIAVADYRLSGQTIYFSHTGVPDQLSGRGIGSVLVKAALADARSRGLEIQSGCSFVDHLLAKGF